MTSTPAVPNLGVALDPCTKRKHELGGSFDQSEVKKCSIKYFFTKNPAGILTLHTLQISMLTFVNRTQISIVQMSKTELHLVSPTPQLKVSDKGDRFLAWDGGEKPSQFSHKADKINEEQNGKRLGSLKGTNGFLPSFYRLLCLDQRSNQSLDKVLYLLQQHLRGPLEYLCAKSEEEAL